MEYQIIINQINRKKLEGIPFYTDLLVLKEHLENTTLSHYIKTQLYYNLSADYLQSNDQHAATEMIERTLQHVEETIKKESPGKEDLGILKAIRTKTELLKVEMCSNIYISMVRMINKSEPNTLSKKEIFYFCMKHLGTDGFIGIILEYVEQADDLKVCFQRVCENRYEIPDGFIERLRAIHEISYGRLKEYALIGIFMFENKDEKFKVRPCSIKDSIERCEQENKRNDGPSANALCKSLYRIFMADEKLLRFVILSLIKKSDLKRIIWLIARIEEERYLFSTEGLEFVRLVKRFIYLNTIDVYEMGEIKDIIADLSSYYVRRGEYRKVYDLHSRYEGVIPVENLFITFIRLNMMESAGLIYKESEEGCLPKTKDLKKRHHLKKEHLFEYYLKTGEETLLVDVLLTVETPRECLRYIKMVHDQTDMRLLISLVKLVVTRFGMLEGSLKLVVVSMVYMGKVPPLEQLEIITLLRGDEMSEYQKEWLYSVIFNNLVDLKDKGHVVAYKAVRMLHDLCSMDDEGVCLFLTVFNEQSNGTVDILMEYYEQYVKYIESRDEGTGYEKEVLVPYNLILFYEQFLRCSNFDMAQSILERLDTEGLSDDNLLLLLKISCKPEIFRTAMKRQLVDDEVMVRLVERLLLTGPQQLYNFIVQTGCDFREGYEHTIELIKSHMDEIELMGDEGMMEFFNSL